jgi:hypothetical protein
MEKNNLIYLCLTFIFLSGIFVFGLEEISEIRQDLFLMYLMFWGILIIDIISWIKNIESELLAHVLALAVINMFFCTGIIFIYYYKIETLIAAIIFIMYPIIYIIIPMFLIGVLKRLK